MFDKEFFFELCEKYGVEVKEGKGKSMIKLEDGTEKELTKEDIKQIFGIEK